MEDMNIKQKNKEKRISYTKMTSQNKSIMFLPETNKSNKKRSLKSENGDKSIKTKFGKKSEFPKDKEIDDCNKSLKEDNCKSFFQFNSDNKLIRNSVSQDFIAKLLEINNTESTLKNNSSNFLFFQKDETFSNNINSIKSNLINANNNQNVLEYEEESKISAKKNKNNKIFETNPYIKNKNTDQNLSKNKNNKNSNCKSVSRDNRKHGSLKSESSYSLFAHKSQNDYKYNSSISDNYKIRFKKAEILFGLHQISDSSNITKSNIRSFSHTNLPNVSVSQQSNLKSNNEIKYSMSKRQEEIAQNIMGLDLNKLQKEVYEYENTDVTDAINRLPTHKFDSDTNKNNNNQNKLIIKHFKTENNKKIKTKKCIKNIKERFRILRRVRYVYDSLDDEEYEDEEDNNFYLEPDSNFILVLDFIILAVSLFDLIFLPVYLSSSPFNEKSIIKDFIFIFIDVVFIIDFVSGFFKAFINFDEDLIKDSASIIKNYLKTWFSLDFICGIPMYSILKAIKIKFVNNNCYKSCYFDNSGRNLYHLFELFKLLKIIKIFRNNLAEKKIEYKINNINFFYYWGHFIKHVFIFISILNLSSCLFIFSARNSYPNWILISNMNIHNFTSIYICSFYYIITTVTTVGYGDIEITSMTERIFEILFLIIGTCLYSWMLTSASNYIKKMNEKNIKFEQKLEILDIIRTNYPLMSNDLYRRIYKLLYYKKCHEEVDKNIILDSLPYSIKNNLLIQMYYPIITNFKFFKYFRNSEFIIEIVSVLKPLVGMKGDLLLNEGDYVEDIIFNKSGILSLEIFIDLNNPYEFIKEYLVKYNLENFKNLKNLDSNIEFNPLYRKNSLNSSFYSKSSFNLNKMNNSSFRSINNLNSLMSIKNEKSILNREKITEKKFKYLKILKIREKEHFGDVLMFLNEPSPLNIKVNSKNAEILLLNRTDVVKISANFPNIWKRINEKSIFNLEQIKNIIMRKLSVFCYANDIKIESLYYKKDIKTGQNRFSYSLIPIPDLIQKEILNQNINLNETFSRNSSGKNTFVIKEVQSSEESKTNSILSKEIKYSYSKNNTLSKKGESRKMTDSIKLSTQEEYDIDEIIHHKRNNKYYDQNTTENQDHVFTYSKSYINQFQNKNTVLSNKYTKNTITTNISEINNNVDNIIIKENYPSKKYKNSYLSNSPLVNSGFNTNGISSLKGLPKNQNFIEKSKINKKLISIPSFNFTKKNTINNCELEYVNDEIYPNENFEIKIPDNEQNLTINKNNKSQKNLILNFPESSKKLLTLDKENPLINIIEEAKKEKNKDVSNNSNSNNKFNNLKISFISTFEIKSSYDNINEFTNYRYISDYSLIQKTKIFLRKECGLLYDTNTKFVNIPHHNPNHNERRKSKSSEMLSSYAQNIKFYDHTNNIDNLSLINNSKIYSPHLPKELEKLKFIKTSKNNEKYLENILKDAKKVNKSFGHIKRNATIKEDNKLFKNRNSICRNSFRTLSPEKGKRKVEVSSDDLLNIKTKKKLNLMTKNMERDSLNLNNPNEYYVDLFNNFYKQKMKKRGSVYKTKVAQNNRGKYNSKESEESDKENSSVHN